MSWWSKAKERQKTNTEVQLLKRLIANQHFITNRMEAIAAEISNSLTEIRKTTNECRGCHENGGEHPK